MARRRSDNRKEAAGLSVTEQRIRNVPSEYFINHAGNSTFEWST